jgi:multimeric flavodoxin WrbA/putative sterol carrier protein
MNVYAVNSSARPEGQSKTRLLMDSLTRGMQEAGADVDSVDLRDKKVKNCIGCFTCWTKTPGKCIHRDDMSREIFPRLLEADLVVYATPLFHHTINATMKAFIERTLPIMEPFMERREGRWQHPARRPLPGAVVLSVAGFPALSAFDAMTHYVNYLFGGPEGRLWAEIYRPGAEALKRNEAKLEEILDATRQAGRELVTGRQVRPETLQRIQQKITDDLDVFSEVANCMWKTCIEEGVTLQDAEQRNLVPRPDSMNAFLSVMQVAFNGKEAGDAARVLQFEFSGRVEGTCHFRVDRAGIRAAAAAAERPDLVVRAPFDVWMDILTGKADGGRLLMDGRYVIEGDTDLLVNMSRIFGKR